MSLVFYLPLLCLSQSKRSRQVETAVESLRKAMESGNRNQLDKLTAAALSYGHSGGAVETKEEFIQKLVSGQSDFVSILLTGQTITVSGKTAIVRHLLQATTNDNGKPGTVKLKILLVWQLEKSGWKLLARQAVKAN